MNTIAPRTGFLVVQKFGTEGVVTTETWPIRFGHTRDELYVEAVAREWGRVEDAARQVALAAMWSALLEVDNPPLQAVLQLHAPDTDARSWLTCSRCDGDDLDPGDWPCSTVTAAAEACGIEVPS